MAQSGIFRTSMRGFNKQEVLQYIEEMNNRSASQETAATTQIAALQQEVTQLREVYESTRQALAASEENATQLQNLVNDYRRTVKDLGDSAAKADALNRERVELHAQKVQAEQSVAALKVKTETQEAQIAALSAELETQRVSAQQLEVYARQQDAARQALAENRRYRALIGHVGTFVADVRQMNQSILDSTCREGVELTEAIEAQLTILEAQLADSRQELAQLRQGLLERQNAVNDRLDTMMQRLEQNARPKADEGV